MNQNFRVGQRVLVDGYNEMVVCDVRDDGTVYAMSATHENERRMIANTGELVGRVETGVAGRCKCLAATLDDHRAKVAAGGAAHVYTGFFWQTQNDSQETE